MILESIPKRLKAERKRLKLTQTTAAALVGVRYETWNRYESGSISFGMDVIEALAKEGADLQYIFTGERQTSLVLTREEKELIELYRTAPLGIKAAALGALTAGTAQQSSSAKQVFLGSVGQVNSDSIVNNFGSKKKR